MRLNPTVLSILAGTLAGAALCGCGGSQATETTSTARTEAEVEEETTTTVSTSTVPPATLPSSNGPQEEEVYAVDCGRG